MYAVSSTWAAANDQLLAPEGFVELSCYIPELDKTLVYTKKDLMSFAHQQTGSLVSGELPKNHIEFSLDNSDGKWNPNSPRGLERYLSERLKITLRYGFSIDGVIEWIPGGVFYLCEWNTSLDGLSASFVARDVFEYMLDTPYTGALSGTLYEVALNAITEVDIPEDVSVSISEELHSYQVDLADYDGKLSVAEILQKCANASGCVLYQDRKGVLTIKKLRYSETGYIIPLKLSPSYPKVELSRSLKNVSVTYGVEGVYLLPCNDSGETQTVENDFILTENQAAIVAEWVADGLRGRKTISGEFRSDPRIDLFDVLRVENKYGTVTGVAITDIKYSFSGAFRASYSGQVRGTTVPVYCGEVFSGEVT